MDIDVMFSEITSDTTCVVFFSDTKYMSLSHANNKPFLDTNCRSKLQFSSDANYLELAQTSQFKVSVPQDRSHFILLYFQRCIYFWLRWHFVATFGFSLAAVSRRLIVAASLAVEHQL